MNPSNFASPELSQKLIDFGVVSQFDYWWATQSKCYGGSGKLELHHIEPSHVNDATKAIHWSDICFPENAKKIWPEATTPSVLLFAHQILKGHDWQSWLLDQLTTGYEEITFKNVIVS